MKKRSISHISSSFRKALNPTFLAILTGALLAATTLSPAQAQTPIPPIAIPGIPPGTPIPGIPIPAIPAPGGLPAIPNIPGMPGKLFSPTGSLLMSSMKDEAKRIYGKMRDTLSSADKSKVENIPLLTDPDKEEINAFAGCDDTGRSFVVVTEGMYQVLDLICQTRATDEIFGTSYYDEYAKELAKQQEGKAKVLPLPPGMLDPLKSLDQRKLRRQRQLFQESVAYIVGHELAHHYRGHLGSVCTAGGGGVIKPGDIIRMAKKVVPAINQINEVDSDRAGVLNFLDAGQNESDYKWSEGGALLVLDFFKKMRDLNPTAILFTFMASHPAPEIRAPIVKQTSNYWRLTHPGATTGTGTGTSSSGGGIGIPFPFPFPAPASSK